ncbi:hypothetical protein GGR54DRAFT_595985 [Hypoxylon sp. NC1633]|nr:hypothetical protein GGR54DRAFT_595985 [Hypoxylon sp. NC1633]
MRSITFTNRVQYIFSKPHQQHLFASFLYHLATRDFRRPPIRRLFHKTTSVRMPTYIVTCKPEATPEQVTAAKKRAEEQGGKIGHEYSLIKGFSVTFPSDAITTLKADENIQNVEMDQEVKTQ